jgi:hypothetical protein
MSILLLQKIPVESKQVQQQPGGQSDIKATEAICRTASTHKVLQLSVQKEHLTIFSLRTFGNLITYSTTSTMGRTILKFGNLRYLKKVSTPRLPPFLKIIPPPSWLLLPVKSTGLTILVTTVDSYLIANIVLM